MEQLKTARVGIFDFDGTFSDPVLSGEVFGELYLPHVANSLGINVNDLIESKQFAAIDIANNRSNYGWALQEGKIICGPNDHLIGIQTRVRAALQLLGKLDENAEKAMLQAYLESYPKVPFIPRKNIVDVIEAVISRGLTTKVVTNSDTGKVSKLLEDIPRLPKMAVIGNAKKYLLHPHPFFAHIPETVEIPGINRPIFLHRGHYCGAILEACNGGWPAFVIGDLPEMDIELPRAVANASGLPFVSAFVTSGWSDPNEIAYYQNQPNSLVTAKYDNQFISDLEEALDKK